MILYNKVKSTFMVDGEIYKRIRILAIERNVEVSTIIEEAMREKLEREYPHYQPPISQQQQQSQQPQSQQLQPQQYKFSVNLPGIEFPTDRSKIIKNAEKANPKPIIDFLESISNRKYKNKSDLENELSNEVKTTKLSWSLNFIKKGGSIIFEIDDRKLTGEQHKERLLKQENQLKLIQ
jgi:hypothetical protein